MSEEVVNTETPAEVVDGGNLPSDNVAPDYSGFDLNDDVKGKFKDGKLNGRFGSINEVLDKLKEAEDFKANTIRDQKTAETETVDANAQTQANANVAEIKATANRELIPAFADSGMVMTPEIESKLTEAGIDVRDFKLDAIEYRDLTEKAYGLTGGKDNYQSMIAWGRETLTGSQQASFQASLEDGVAMGEYAIKGLYADFKQASDNGDVGRIEGQTVFTGVQPYANRRELYKDKDYIESNAGRKDTAAQKMYRARLGKTPEAVIYGR